MTTSSAAAPRIKTQVLVRVPGWRADTGIQPASLFLPLQPRLRTGLAATELHSPGYKHVLRVCVPPSRKAEVGE
jgi:hypothetical protein